MGDWILHADLGVLRRDSEEQRLTAKALHVLLVLIDAGGSAVSRDELLDAVWGASYPTDAVVSRAIADLRSAFGEAAGDQAYLRTVPKFGYQLVATGEAAEQPAKPNRWPMLAAVLALAVVAWWFWPATDSIVQSGQLRLPVARPLTADPGLEHQPRMIAGGDWIVYAALRPDQGDWDLFRISTKDGSSQAVAAIPGVNEHGPAASPAGDEVAYARLTGTGCEVVVQSIAFGVPEAVADCTSKFPTLVDWSPDGDWLAYTNLEADDPQGHRRLYLVNLDSGAQRQLSDAVSPTGSDFYPRYSPSGSRVAFLRGEPQPDHRASLWIVNVDSGDERRLTQQPAQLGGMTWIDDDTLLYASNDAGHFETRRLTISTGSVSPVAGPDLVHPEYDRATGMLIAASRRSERDLAVIEEDGAVRPIASSTSDDHHGVFSPSGDFVAFISRRSGYDELWIADMNSSAVRRLTRFDGTTIRYPSWHPAGQRILFTVQTEQGERLHIVDIVSGAIQQTGPDSVDATTPNWLPDGTGWAYGCRDAESWGICVGGTGQDRRIASEFYRPTPLDGDYAAVVDNAGILYRMSLQDGSVEAIWDGLPGSGRLGWVTHGQSIIYSAPAAASNSGRIIRRSLVDGDEAVTFEGPMPLADTTLSADSSRGRILFTRYQAASDDLVSFDVSKSRALQP